MGSPKIGNDLQTTLGTDIVVKQIPLLIVVMGEVVYIDQFERRLKSNHVSSFCFCYTIKPSMDGFCLIEVASEVARVHTFHQFFSLPGHVM